MEMFHRLGDTTSNCFVNLMKILYFQTQLTNLLTSIDVVPDTLNKAWQSLFSESNPAISHIKKSGTFNLNSFTLPKRELLYHKKKSILLCTRTQSLQSAKILLLEEGLFVLGYLLVSRELRRIDSVTHTVLFVTVVITKTPGSLNMFSHLKHIFHI